MGRTPASRVDVNAGKPVGEPEAYWDILCFFMEVIIKLIK